MKIELITREEYNRKIDTSLRAFIWTHSFIGGGGTLIVLARSKEEAIATAKADPRWDNDIYIPKDAFPVECTIDSPKVLHYFDYYE